MDITTILLYLFAALGVAIIASVQFALCFLKPLIFKLLPLIALGVAWVLAYLEVGHISSEFIGNPHRFIMMAITPFALVGMLIGWRLYQIKGKK